MKPGWGLKTPHLKLSAGDNIFKQVLLCTDIKSKNIFFFFLFYCYLPGWTPQRLGVIHIYM